MITISGSKSGVLWIVTDKIREQFELTHPIKIFIDQKIELKVKFNSKKKQWSVELEHKKNNKLSLSIDNTDSLLTITGALPSKTKVTWNLLRVLK